MRKRRFWSMSVSFLASIAGVAFTTASVQAATNSAPNPTTAPSQIRTSAIPEVRVMTIGGSVAHGWNDPRKNGYLHRAFVTLTHQFGVAYTVYDRTIPGANAVQLQDTLYKGSYEKWLRTIHPNIVVLSWGLLNDCLPKTPLAEFDKYVGQEIKEALAAHAMVFMVTPPVTRASYTQYLTQQQMYVNAEIQLAASFHNPHLYTFDIFDQMKQYLINTNQTYVRYSADGWHPNSAGHRLAARMLVTDIDNAFNLTAPALPNSASPTWSSKW